MHLSYEVGMEDFFEGIFDSSILHSYTTHLMYKLAYLYTYIAHISLYLYIYIPILHISIPDLIPDL